MGSLNIDIVTMAEHLPKPGETLFGRGFEVFVGGGKGANQAVALGKLGAEVWMIGKLGDRFYSAEYLALLKESHVHCDAVVMENDAYPGTAVIIVDHRGENSIVVSPGANQKVDRAFVDEHWDTIADCDICLLQCEIPFETNLYVAKKLKAMGKTVILDPAPAVGLSEEIFQFVDFLTPNEVELQMLSGLSLGETSEVIPAAQALRQKGADVVIAKVGKRGSVIVSAKEVQHIPAYDVNAVDTTAAGDSFNAGFAFGLAKGEGIVESVRLANAVAGLSTTAMGAQTAMPSWQLVEEFMKGKQ